MSSEADLIRANRLAFEFLLCYIYLAQGTTEASQTKLLNNRARQVK